MLIELKNLANENADIWRAYDQSQTYKEQVRVGFREGLHNVLKVRNMIRSMCNEAYSSTSSRFLKRDISMNRKYSNSSIEELEAVFSTHADNQYHLNMLRQELSYRNSQRAKRLLKKVTLLLPPLETNEHLIKKPTREQQDSQRVTIQIDPWQRELQVAIGIDLLTMRKRMLSEINDLAQRLEVRRQIANSLSAELSSLRSDIREHVMSIVPEVANQDDDPTTEYERRKQMMRIELIQKAARSFPRYSEIEPAETNARNAQIESDSVERKLATLTKKFGELEVFRKNNELSIMVEAENQVIKLVAEKIEFEVDELEILEFIRSTGLADPIGLMARANMYVSSTRR